LVPGNSLGHVVRQVQKSAAEQLWPLVYDELRRLAAAKLGCELRITPYEVLQAISNRLRSVYETRGSPQ